MFTLDMMLIQALFFLMAIIMVDVILGVCLAMIQGNFSLAELPRFLRTKVLPYYISIMSLVALAMVTDIQQFGTKPLAWTVMTAYASKVVLVDVRQKIFTLFGVAHEKVEEPVKD